MPSDDSLSQSDYERAARIITGEESRALIEQARALRERAAQAVQQGRRLRERHPSLTAWSDDNEE